MEFFSEQKKKKSFESLLNATKLYENHWTTTTSATI